MLHIVDVMKPVITMSLYMFSCWKGNVATLHDKVQILLLSQCSYTVCVRVCVCVCSVGMCVYVCMCLCVCICVCVGVCVCVCVNV